MKLLSRQHVLSRLLVGTMIILGGCAGGPYANRDPAPGDRIGTLGVSGPNVVHNGNRAANGTAVRVGDTITTGPNSSAIIDFSDGGFFQLDQDTDPIFVVKRLQAGLCILARIFSGQAFLDKQQFCIESPALDAVNNSRINIRVTSQQTGITVIEGSVNISRPRDIHVLAAQQLIMNRQGVARLHKLTELELAETVRWRKNYTFQGWCCKDNRIYASDREQCPAGNFSFDRALLERQCASASEPNFPINFGLPIFTGPKTRTPTRPRTAD